MRGTGRLLAVLGAVVALAGCGSGAPTSLLILDPIHITASGAQLVAQLSRGGRVAQTTFLVKEAEGFTFCPELADVTVVDSAYTAEGWTSLIAARNTESDGATFTYADASGLKPGTSYAVCVITTVRDRPALGADQQGAVGYAVIFQTAGTADATSTPTPAPPTPEASPSPSPTPTETPKPPSSPTPAPRTPTAVPKTSAPAPTPAPTPEATSLPAPTPPPPPPTAAPTPVATATPTAPAPTAAPTAPPTPRPTPTPEPVEDEGNSG